MACAVDQQVETDAARVQAQRFAAQRGAGLAARADADAAQRRVQRRQQVAAERVVEIDHRRLQPRRGEQARLGRAVAGHVAVVIQMIAGEIGEHRHVEVHRIDAALVQRVRTHFHRHRLRAGVAQLGQ